MNNIFDIEKMEQIFSIAHTDITNVPIVEESEGTTEFIRHNGPTDGAEVSDIIDRAMRNSMW